MDKKIQNIAFLSSFITDQYFEDIKKHFNFNIIECYEYIAKLAIEFHIIEININYFETNLDDEMFEFIQKKIKEYKP